MRNKKLKITENQFFLLIFSILVLSFLIFTWNKKNNNPELDAFAKCLASKGVTMYGANWCSHCQNEKKAFGKSFQFVPYVECPQDPQKCLSLGVDGYPTWIFKDGKKLVGEQGIEKLAKESGCELTVKSN